MDPDQTAPIGAVCSGSTLLASILNLSVMLRNYLQRTTSADNIFRCNLFLAPEGLKSVHIACNTYILVVNIGTLIVCGLYCI